jgi:YD repeat-containing protein
MPGYSQVSGIKESEKMPLENRVWYDYDGQYPADPTVNVMGTSGQPSAIGRVLDDGTTQLRRFKYDALGHVTNSIDPVGRSMTYLYSTNLVDLLESHQTTGTNNDLIAKYLYNSQHLPVAVWDAAAQMTTNTYNPRGQLLTTTNPRGETRTCNYDTNGYLLSVDSPLPGTNDATSFTYDSVGRVRTTTGPDGYTLTYGYDNLDRLTNITYPDGTLEAFAYTNLDRVQSRDRLGRITYRTYDSLRQLTSVQDPLGRTIRYEYCDCGSMSALIDLMGRKTTWDHDIQGRVTGKQYTDGSRVAYTYENTTSRLKMVTDEKGQLKVYSYFPDAQIATPTVTFTFDQNYNRMTSMQDGIGTTMWSYYPAGGFGALQVASVKGPWSNELVTYQYDELGRVAIGQTPVLFVKLRTIGMFRNELPVVDDDHDVFVRLRKSVKGAQTKAPRQEWELPILARARHHAPAILR